MSLDVSGLETRYLDSCKRHEVLPNSTVLSWLYQAKSQKSIRQNCNVVILLDYLQDDDFSPLIDAFLAINSSDIDAVDIIHESQCPLNKQYVMSLLHAVNLKLRVLDLQDMSLVDDLFWDPSQSGLSCQILKLRSSEIRELTVMGRFEQLHTLNLDFCTALTSFQKDCFSCMPNLKRLSLCETRVANLWTTSAALSKLPSMVELRFQNCLCCKGTGPCAVSSSAIADSLGCDRTGSEDAYTTLKKYVSHQPSPICFEKHYREYMIVSLPCVVVLDDVPISKLEREMAKNIFSEFYEFLPYKRQHKESVVSILHMRETGASKIRPQKSSKPRLPIAERKSQYFYSRSLCAAKLGSSSWPLLNPVSNICHITKEGGKSLRPRQFEYHPSNSSFMVFGTLEGEIHIINHENGHLVGYIPSLGAMNSVLGLSWLKKHPSKFLAGSDNGSLRLYDINHLLPSIPEGYACPSNVTFDDFEHLTSVHVNSTDDQFLASGYSKHVGLYDIDSGRCLGLFRDMHRGPINVAKFSHHSPSVFVTSSFDHDVKMWDLRQKPIQPCYTVSSSRGNVMVCFSSDDLHLLVSAVDNEVKQLMAVDGRLHTKFDIPSTGSAHNYTRSYYMNGRDYIISGSCEEPVVRICCAQTGRRLRDVYLEGNGSGNSMFVQSLRGDPFRNFQMAILATSMHPSSKSDIIKVDLLATNPNQSSCLGV